MRSFRPPRATGLCPPGAPLRAPRREPQPAVTPAPAPSPVVDEVPPPRMDCTPLLTGVLRGRVPQPGVVALICEDEMLRERLRRDLEEDGHQVLAAASGPALIPSLLGCTPSILLVDEEVVDPEPLELCCTLRDDPTLSGVEILLLTRNTRVEARRVAFHAGARDLLQLPYLRSELRARVGGTVAKDAVLLVVEAGPDGAAEG